MIQVDILQTVFSTSGIQNVVGALTSAQNATDRLANAEARLNKVQGTGNQYLIDRAQRGVNIAQRHLTESSFAAAAAEAQPFLKVFHQITTEAEKAVEATAKFGTEVMNLKAIAGSSGTEAAGILNLFQGAGIGSGGAHALAGLNQKVFSGEGQGALMQLGISPRQGESSIELFDQIAERLKTMKDGWYKMRIEQQLGVEGMQELLRMSDGTRQAILGFSDSMGGKALQTIQRFNEATGLLGVAIQGGIIQPIGVDLMKIITPVIEFIDQLIEKWHRLDDALGGSASWVVTIGGLAAGFAAAAGAAIAFGSAIKALRSIEEIQIVLESMMDALAGQWGNIAGAAAIGAGAGIILYGANAMLSGGDDKKTDDSVDRFGNAVDNFGNIIGQMRDMWGQGGLPKNMSANDAAHLMRMQAQGAIS